jgi:hypothetical protein
MTSGNGGIDLSGIDQFTRGDARQARDLRATVAVIARRTEDPALRELCVKVLQGRESVRRMFEHPTFWDMASASMANLEEGLEQLDDEQREDLLAKVGDADEVVDEAVDDALMDGVVPPGPDEPPPAPRDHGPSRWG